MPKILIVDDEATIRDLFKFVFEDNGYEVETAKNGKDALEKLNNFTPDIILLDIAMPEMDGSAFAENLKKFSLQRPELKKIPFIVMTGENFVSAKYPGFHNNPSCKSFIPKMAIPEDVLREANDILREEGKF